ncbi:hypothetical protein HMPREF3069_29050 [Achromobacter xylosoxidans]|uniref:DUF1120 domain-containing protein n=1 Tax=Alcaligenes xylosoxydans xylosoxydans TaxID=85698 RepID=UPI0008A14019|nr:DUF1120 domain-containing protein [Achromobacter xylosoxidans]OFS31490.1 hypothetical protein HMPREF3069_29050 [Achromobacter xylosoxidans]
MRINQKLATLSLALAASMVSFGAQAQSIDVRVIGTITPAACIPTLAGGGVVDYGNIAAATLNQTAATALPSRAVAFSITCDAPTRVALRAMDNRASSAVPGIIQIVSPGLTEFSAFGLGVGAGKNIGAFALQLEPGGITLDGSSAITNMASADGGATWSGPFGGYARKDGRIMSWATTGSTVPTAFTTMAGTLAVHTVIDKAGNLDLSTDVVLDGLATLELVYL